ncbi:hypothetical protein Goshw_007514 [Gossypium schwendimanii]|uniref:Uncharacterized protein n=1 Tax=Gossypium schwendimanii TaxID=34291 RepID=A0A7J9N9X1_GOSSC|nr:hypothetical protein [Gossypium schwendimanii]
MWRVYYHLRRHEFAIRIAGGGVRNHRVRSN